MIKVEAYGNEYLVNRYMTVCYVELQNLWEASAILFGPTVYG